MIRIVADRIASSTRPTYRGRHRRTGPGKPASAFGAPTAEPHDHGAEGHRSEEELAIIAGGPAAPPV